MNFPATFLEGFFIGTACTSSPVCIFAVNSRQFLFGISICNDKSSNDDNRWISLQNCRRRFKDSSVYWWNGTSFRDYVLDYDDFPIRLDKIKKNGKIYYSSWNIYIYNNINNGHFVFDGINDYVSFSANLYTDTEIGTITP